MADCSLNIIPTFTRCLLLYQLLVSIVASQHQYLVFEEAYQPENNVIKLKNMVLDPSTGALYVGSVNRLYKLSGELDIEATIATGPRQDTTKCVAPPVSCPFERETTDNINKLLVVDQDRLFVCGSIYQGSCNIRRLDDLGLLGNDSYEEIVPNTANGTSVGFIAQGPYNENVLYIATSLADWLDKAVPTVSSRILPRENNVSTLFSILTNTQELRKLEINVPAEVLSAGQGVPFNIYYIYGFSNTNFSYFVAVQPLDYRVMKSPYYTKIVQICQQDNKYASYSELPLACYKGGKDYKVAQSATVTTIGSKLASANGFQVGERVLIVTFSESVVNQLEPVEASAVCMYSIKSINQYFIDRRKECAKGETAVTDLNWLRNADCEDSPYLVDHIDAAGTEYCHTWDQAHPLGGKNPIPAQAIYTDNSILTAIAATAHLEETVLFLGDHHGHLKKLRVVEPSKAELYEEEVILANQKPVVQNGILFSVDKNFIYFMTVRKIHKIPVENCSQYTSCESCLGVGNGTGDPYCGWCSLQKSCTRRNETKCTGSEDLSNLRWLGNVDQCIAILSVDPPNTPRQGTQELTLTTRGLPKLDDGSAYGYQCTFGDLPLAEATVVTMNDTSLVQCLTPASDVLPPIGPGFLRVELAIHSTETSLDIVSTDFDFYDCGTFTSCVQCIGNKYKCDWCIFENKCCGNSTSCDASGIITKEEGTQFGELLCPRIVNDSVDILLAADVTSGFLVPTAHLPIPKLGEKGYKCVLQYEDRAEEVEAVRVSESSLQCNPRIYEYSADVNNLPVSLAVLWNKNFEIDNPDDLIVNLYKCDVKRPNCGICLAGNDKYQCGWCSDGGVCSLQSQCGGEWLNGDALCIDPSITNFDPMSGYIKGRTALTITGINLGLRVENIVSIMVAGVECGVRSNDYIIATQVMCYTLPTETPAEGPIKVVIQGGNGTDTVTAVSTTHFKYVIPILTGVEPTLGPRSGGTNITITGQNLDAGRKVDTVIEGLPCQQISRSSNELLCTTPAGFGNSSVAMAFDDEALMDATVRYQYKQDPVITGLNRYDTIKSGGLMIEASGTNLDVIQQPKIQFIVDGTKLIQDCNPPKPNSMSCPTPDIGAFLAADYSVENGAETQKRRVVRETGQDNIFSLSQSQYGFILDGVKNYTTLEGIPGIQAFKFYPDPVYFKFKEENHIRKLKFNQNNILEIAGQNLTPAYKEGDVRVAIGDAFCDEVTLIVTLLTCSPPYEQPASVTGTKFPEVVVYQGNLNFTVGQLQYIGKYYTVYIIGGCAGGLFCLLIICIIVYCKTFRSDTTDRRIRDQIALYEMQVAKECKEAFAELQTAVTVLTRDLVAIPFREYHMYCIKTLFPDQPNHSVLKELSLAGVSQTNIEKGLVQFELLVNNKQFLLTFIRTLEEQKSFTQKDKSNVASLMMVALQGKMDYCTTILKVLLADLIEKHVQKGRERLLMRSDYENHSFLRVKRQGLHGCLKCPWNESVAEKMVSNWLTFLLYNFIKDTAGEPLFKLFIAIKQQMEKGPVDAITGEARYGLSEVKVIRQQINYTVMMINAIGLGKDPQMVQVKVLDYDTIFQVKEKILDALCKTTPYSLRPPKDELDLEWRSGEDGRMLLQDDDDKTEGEWKRLNMLRNYSGIKDGATIALVPKQGFTMSAFSNSRGMSLPTANSPARSMTTPMLAADTDINGAKLWHLVKQSDSEYHKSGDKDHKMLAEIYLPRLLTTKGVLQSYIDELFEMIFSVNHRSNTLPLCIKYLFDFLDDQARHHCIPNQEEVVHSWKSNSLPLRFWVNLIKNPDIIFDIYKSETVDACLSIIGQTLMDSCSVSDHPLTKDSPSSRLLYAKDIPRYKEWVSSYYNDIKNYPAVSDQDMSAMLAEHSVRHQYDFHSKSALNELYFNYAQPYKRPIVEALEENEYNNLAEKFDKLCEDLNNTL
ncbi:plexin-A2-like isoform X1 [Asterias rubens]|uniref:plexin-A2-like isoform X1 n=1 Tax=Asterias rubens TaxID=7604 RepID=UPI0014551E1E|nr:plexin-A2-like isoform X1 [Asterias rubens]